MLHAGLLIAGKYRVLEKLGEGAMGSVWLAKNEVTEREFAIKVLLPKAAAAPAALGRFLQEAKVCGSLRHPSILEIYDAGTAPELDGAPYLVMERLDGAALDVVLHKSGRLTPRLAVDVLVQIARGIDKAHAKGIIHRDLKPANIFLHRPGSGAVEPKVLDFGLSKIVHHDTAGVKFTDTSAVLGSPLYMSSEQLAGDRVLDGRSDVHALGVVLWECLTGGPPFTTVSYNLMVVEILTGPRPKLRDVVPSASEELAQIVARAFAIEPEDRFPSAAAFADALDTELTRLGGGALGGRTAAVDVLDGLTLASKVPPPMNGGHPLSPDRVSKQAQDIFAAGPPLVATMVAPLRAPSPVPASAPSLAATRVPSPARLPSPSSLAETEPELGRATKVVAPSAVAVSKEREPTERGDEGSSAVVRGAVIVGVVAAAALGLFMMLRGEPKSVKANPTHVAPAAIVTSTPPPSAGAVIRSPADAYPPRMR